MFPVAVATVAFNSTDITVFEEDLEVQVCVRLESGMDGLQRNVAASLTSMPGSAG